VFGRHASAHVAWALVASALAGCLDAPEPVQPDALAMETLALACVVLPACERSLSGPGVNEFSVAVHPLDPDNAIVTANDYGAQENPALRAVNRLWGSWWFTKDGGLTWTKRTLPGMLPELSSSLSSYFFVGDLVVAFGPDGTAYVAGIAYSIVVVPGVAAIPVYRNALFLARSTDGGETFSEPALVDSYHTEAAFHDKPALAVDAEGRIFLVWNFMDQGQRGSPGDQGMRVAASEDGGSTWRTEWISRNDWGISASIAVGPDGAVNVAWRAYEPDAIRFSRSTDHGRTWSPTVEIHRMANLPLVLPNTSYRAFALPTLAARPDGMLLAIFPDAGEHGDSDVFLARSRDDGATWTLARLNADGTRTAQFLPTLAAAPDGRVVAAWLDRRDDPSDKTYHLYAAVSDDGATFREFRVTTAASREAGDGTLFIGDYLGAAIGGERVYFAWPDLREDGKSRLWAGALRLPELPR